MQSTIEKIQTATVKDDYDRKVLLIAKAFREISRLCFEYDYSLTPDDWRILDEARLDEDGLSYEELRQRLADLYRRIKRACVEKVVNYAQREAQAVR